jgi:hypothetical protein
MKTYFWLPVFLLNAACYNHEFFIVGKSHETTSHNTWVCDLTYFSRSQRSNSINWLLFVPGAYLLKH